MTVTIAFKRPYVWLSGDTLIVVKNSDNVINWCICYAWVCVNVT